MGTSARYSESENIFPNRPHWDENGEFVPAPKNAPGCWCPKESPPEPKLCQQCRDLRLRHLIFCEGQGREVDLGELEALKNRLDCDLCSLIALGCQQVWQGADWNDHSTVLHSKCFISSLELDRQQARGYVLRIWTNYQFIDFEIVWKGKGSSVLPVDKTFEVCPNINIDLLRTMLRTCEETHPSCDTKIPQVTPDMMQIIDLQNMCVSPAPRNCRYCALSYVWGRSPGTWLTLLRKNNDSLSQRNSLVGAALPKTVRDTMQLCIGLRERYLWVDSLCIIQDDPEFQKQQIDMMDMIYATAHFTIVVAAGDNANAGIPGVNSWLRDMPRETITMQDIEVSNTIPLLRDTVERSVWNTRGWTYQERMFARRCILLSEAQAYFACPQGVQYERKDRLDQTTTRFDRFTYVSSSNKLIEVYKKNVADYTLRSLSSQADILRAFQGVMNEMSRNFNQTFYFGLPNGNFDDALLWQPVKHSNRRVVPETYFPSWSWASSLGAVKYTFMEQRVTDLKSVRAFWQEGKEPDTFQIEWYFNSAGFEVSSIKDISSTTALLPNPPPRSLLDLTLAQDGRLLFRTQRAFFVLKNSVPFKTIDSWWTDYTTDVDLQNICMSSIYHSNHSFSSEPIGFIELDKDFANNSLANQTEWEFLAISLGATDIQNDFMHRNFTMRRNFNYPLVWARNVRELVVNALLVERLGNTGVCRRLGVGKIYLDFWEEAETSVEWIVLE